MFRKSLKEQTSTPTTSHEIQNRNIFSISSYKKIVRLFFVAFEYTIIKTCVPQYVSCFIECINVSVKKY